MFSGLYVTDVVVAEFGESISSAIPQIISTHINRKSELSEYGNISNFPT